MTPSSRLPRRFAQRQTLRHGRDGAPPMTLPNGQEQLRVYEPRVKMKRNWRRRSASSNNSESDPDPDYTLNRNSGYNSETDYEADSNDEAIYYQQKEDEFEAEGVTLSNPCDGTKATMEAELERWEL